MTELLEFKKDFPDLTCFSCRGSFEAQNRLPPCDTRGRCSYTKDGKEPPTERLSGFSALAWRLWNMKEALGMEAIYQKFSKFNEMEKEILSELLFHIEAEARRLGLKQSLFEKLLGGA